MKNAVKFERLAGAVFFGIFLVSLALPLRNGLPSYREALPPPSQTLRANPLLAGLRSAIAFTPAYERRYNEHYEGRYQRISLYNQVLLQWLDVRSFPNVLLGRDGWLIYTGEGNLDDYQNARVFSTGDLEEIGGKLAAVQKQMEERGIRFILTAAPNKETIYPEAVPGEIRKMRDESRLDQLAAYLKASSNPVQLLDLRPALLEKKATYPLYYRTDSHWNDRGAYFASAAILGALEEAYPGLGLPALETYAVERGTSSGDLAAMLPAGEVISEPAEWLHPAGGEQAVFLEKTDRVITVSEVDNPALPRAVIFRDSFGNQLEPFLSEQFSRAVYPWSFSIDWALVEREQPDAVIYVIAERYLDRLKEIEGGRDR